MNARKKAAFCQAGVLISSIILIILTMAAGISDSYRAKAPQEIPPLERFLSGEEVELREILHSLQDSAMFPSLVKLWAAKNFPDRRPDEVCRAVIGEIYRAKVKMVLPASIAENVAAKFAEEPVPPTPDTTPTPTPTSAE